MESIVNSNTSSPNSSLDEQILSEQLEEITYQAHLLRPRSSQTPPCDDNCARDPLQCRWCSQPIHYFDEFTELMVRKRGLPPIPTVRTPLASPIPARFTVPKDEQKFGSGVLSHENIAKMKPHPDFAPKPVEESLLSRKEARKDMAKRAVEESRRLLVAQHQMLAGFSGPERFLVKAFRICVLVTFASLILFATFKLLFPSGADIPVSQPDIEALKLELLVAKELALAARATS